MSLALRLVLFGVTLVVLTSGAIGWGLTRAATRDLRADLEARGLAVARGLSVRLAQAVLEGDRGAAQRAVDAVWEEDDIARVSVVDDAGRAFAQRTFDVPPSDDPEARVLYPVVGPSEGDGVQPIIGMVRLRLSQAGLEARQAQYVRQVVRISALVAVVGLAVALAVGLALARPLRRLQRATATIGEGRYHEAMGALPAEGPSEVRALGAQFRRAVAAVAEREATLRDINEQLRETEAARDAMTHMVIHDLKGPIGNVITMLAVLEAGQIEPEDRALVGDVRRRCRALLRTIEQQLNLARLSAGQLTVQRELLEVGELLLGAMDQVRELIAAEGFTTRFDLPDDDIEVALDRGLMERVVVNLLVNAVRHGASPITLAVEQSPGTLTIHVSDAGPGVPAEKEDAVFERFEAGPGGGAGLGLALVRLATEAHGGTVTVRGARFSVSLPT